LAEIRHVLDGVNVRYVSAATGEGIGELTTCTELFLNSLDSHVQLMDPFTRGEVIARVHEVHTVLEEAYRAEGTFVDVRLPRQVAGELEEFILDDEQVENLRADAADGEDSTRSAS